MQNVLYPAQWHALKSKRTENRKIGKRTRRNWWATRKSSKKRGMEKQGRYGSAHGEERTERNRRRKLHKDAEEN